MLERRFPLKWVLLALGAGVFAGVVGTRSLSGTASPSAKPASAAPAPEPAPLVLTQAAPATLGESDKLALRALIREEVHAAFSARSTEGAAGAAPAPAKPVDDDPLAQIPSDRMKEYEVARGAIAEAIRHRSWTNEDRDQVRESLVALPPEVRVEVIRPLLVAINKQEVRVQGPLPFF